ncbi:hypothetical protein GMOD_00000118 [Pyrenophora seminiperda CCB06]|uniref:Uncharacterized protein n=1 Tax=Pyrenophora seminiperda CCB06 TaxID=1302712 RepID=A0A3M7M6F1_9PLEO|nr:hypothetical protein GMOD_00000118 [Pyrenophora seminiperda CCB06]
MLLTMSTTTSTTSPLLSLLSDWHLVKRSTTPPKRLGMLSLEVLALAAAMLVVPLFMHQAVCALDVLYEHLGRRARSPWEREKWLSVLLGVGGLSVWCLCLARLSWGVVLDREVEGEKTTSTLTTTTTAEVERRVEGPQGMEHHDAARNQGILSRIIIPFFLIVLASHFAYALASRLRCPRPFVTRNEVDMMDVMGQLYGLGVG